MMNYIKKFENVGIKIPNIYLPNKNIDYEKFACIAVDQYSYDKQYWKNVENFVKDTPSTYNLIFPEAYMPISDNDIMNINQTMNEYVNKKYIEDIGKCIVYVKRKTQSGIRHGLMVLLDLEQYDYKKGSNSLIRPTEKTVEDRLPIRIKIRQNAILDLPHVIVLYDDKQKLIVNYLNSIYKELDLIYDFELMFGAGNIKGFKIDNDEHLEELSDIFNILKQQINNNLMYAVGDGNHSLASAKICYENNKNEQNRYALVELVNIYDEGINFYPIHRLIMNVNKKDFLLKTKIDLNKKLDLQITQKIIDEYIKDNKQVKIEYMHDKTECQRLGKDDDKINIVFDNFDITNFFDNISKYGTLVRKSFSIGNATDKRFYLESSLLK